MMVADASVWINLAATGFANRILAAFEQPLLITEIALTELDRGRPKGRKAADQVMALIRGGLARVVQLTAADEALFLALVSGPTAETLDDGEAATLAYAERMGIYAVIDERKATSLAERRLPRLNIRSTTDMLLMPAVRRDLDDFALADALYNALVDARMRVPDHHVREVIHIISEDRASRCFSLPARFRPKPSNF